MSAILHCIVTDIENSRMKDQLRAWKAKTDADFIEKLRMLEKFHIKDGVMKFDSTQTYETDADLLIAYIRRLEKRLREARESHERITDVMAQFEAAEADTEQVMEVLDKEIDGWI